MKSIFDGQSIGRGPSSCARAIPTEKQKSTMSLTVSVIVTSSDHGNGVMRQCQEHSFQSFPSEVNVELLPRIERIAQSHVAGLSQV